MEPFDIQSGSRPRPRGYRDMRPLPVGQDDVIVSASLIE